MVKIYSKKRDGSLLLSHHFRVREFWTAGDEIRIDEELVDRLEALYEELDCSKIIITSGYRPGEAGSQHALGKAADVNCWHKTATGEERYQGKEILLAAEKVGFRGIGWIAGSAASRAAVHLDTREKAYRFDEADGNRMVKDNSWYAYFGLEKPGEATGNPYAEPAGLLQKGSQGDGVRWVQWQLSQMHGHGEVAVDGLFGDKTEAAVLAVQREAGLSADGIVGPDTRAALVEKPGAPESGAPSVVYQVYTAANKWLPEVTDYGEGSDGYAGYPGHAVQGVRARLTRGSIEYRIHIDNRWLPWVKDRQDYAGLYGKDADGLQMRLVGLDGYAVEYRVARKDGGYWAWVRNYGEGSEGYAGSFGQPFDRLQCRIVRA